MPSKKRDRDGNQPTLFAAFGVKKSRGESYAKDAKAQAATPAEAALPGPEPAMVQALRDPGWKQVLGKEFNKGYFQDLVAFLDKERTAGKEVFPPADLVFEAFNATPWDKALARTRTPPGLIWDLAPAPVPIPGPATSAVKVVLIGQDPYHGEPAVCDLHDCGYDNHQAHGLCFSVQKGIKTPPSLVNMYKELKTDIPGFSTPTHGYLRTWAEQGSTVSCHSTFTVQSRPCALMQPDSPALSHAGRLPGVLMLNATLTVEAHKANSHAKCGWDKFTSAAIEAVNQEKAGVVFLLWGGFAQKKGKSIDKGKHK
eukprot:gene7645-1366_t